MIKRYCDRCGQQIDEGVHAWYVLEIHVTDGEFRHKELCEECYEYLCEKDEAPKADRKTENSSEKPNNCEDLQDWKDRMWAEAIVTEPTISKMEQVEDEPQTPYDNCQSCLHWVYDGYWYCECNECHYEPKDEPQTDCAWK